MTCPMCAGSTRTRTGEHCPLCVNSPVTAERWPTPEGLARGRDPITGRRRDYLGYERREGMMVLPEIEPSSDDDRGAS